MDKDKSRFIIWLLIVIIILLVTLIFALAIKLNNENNTEILKDNDRQENINNDLDDSENQTTSNEELGDKIDDTEKNVTNINKYGVSIPQDKDVHVYSYIDQQKVIEKGSALDTNLTISLRIPQLKFNTEVAKKINNNILGKFEDYIKAFDENKYTAKLADMKLIADYEYIYTVSENRIYLNVSKFFSNSNASGGGEEFTYIYDITNDKQISISELLTEKGITVNKIVEELYKDYDFNISYGSDEEAKKSVKEALNNNFSNVTIDNIIVDKNFDNNKSIYLNVGVYRDSYRLAFSI